MVNNDSVMFCELVTVAEMPRSPQETAAKSLMSLHVSYFVSPDRF